MDRFLQILSTVGWIGAVLFVVIYHRSSRWWKHGYGRALFILGTVIVSFFTTSMLYNIFGPFYPGRNILRILNTVISVSMIWYLLVTLVRGGAAARRMRLRRLPEDADTFPTRDRQRASDSASER